jgi:hypothetical protein
MLKNYTIIFQQICQTKNNAKMGTEMDDRIEGLEASEGASTILHFPLQTLNSLCASIFTYGITAN